MERKVRIYLDTSAFDARNMVRDGNADFQYWFNKSIGERLEGASIMNAAAFNVADFIKGRVDRTVFSSRKHP